MSQADGKAKKDLEAQMDGGVKNTMKRMNLSTREDVLKQTKRIKKVKKALRDKEGATC